MKGLSLLFTSICDTSSEKVKAKITWNSDFLLFFFSFFCNIYPADTVWANKQKKKYVSMYRWSVIVTRWSDREPRSLSFLYWRRVEKYKTGSDGKFVLFRAALRRRNRFRRSKDCRSTSCPCRRDSTVPDNVPLRRFRSGNCSEPGIHTRITLVAYHREQVKCRLFLPVLQRSSWWRSQAAQSTSRRSCLLRLDRCRPSKSVRYRNLFI